MIYVDKLFKVKNNLWCHLWTDGTKDELHNFAKDLGLKRCWFENKRNKNFPHYDIRPEHRKLAIEKGAKQISLKDWLRD